MFSRYRWLLVGVFSATLLIMGYAYDIYPMLLQIATLKQKENSLNEKLATAKLLPPAIHPKLNIKNPSDKTKLNGMSELVGKILASGLIIQSIELSSFRQQHPSFARVLIHVVLKGDYQQLTALIYRLEGQADSLEWQNFSYKWTEQNNLLITMNIISSDHVSHTQMIKHRDIPANPHNPFCASGTMSQWVAQHDLNAALSIPLDRIKMVGYLQQGSHRQALVLLQNTVLKTVEPGFLLGSERGVVIAIHRNHMLVRLPNGQGVTLALITSS